MAASRQRSPLEYIIAIIKSAGQPTEADSERDGFLSYKSESHAAGMGIAAGFYYGAEGNTRLLSLVYTGAVYGTAKEKNGQRGRIWRDIVKEPHYALGGVIVGVLLGILTRVAQGRPAELPPLPIPGVTA